MQMLAISLDMAVLCASIGAALARRSGATDSFTGSEDTRDAVTAVGQRIVVRAQHTPQPIQGIIPEHSARGPQH
ncbi:MAG TPA: hypothetical protein PK306_12885 [Aquabacterium sp.]|nr:hypothetical protein [Aquabacterium sp.]